MGDNQISLLETQATIITILLFTFFSFFGMHRFYAGKTRSAVGILIAGLMSIVFVGIWMGINFGSFYAEANILIILAAVWWVVFAVIWIVDLYSIATRNFLQYEHE